MLSKAFEEFLKESGLCSPSREECIFFLSPIPWPSQLKCVFLRLFGAKVGQNYVIKPRVNIHYPGRLVIRDFSCIGEEVSILNFESGHLGSHCCVSHQVFLGAGRHSYRDSRVPYRNTPILIGEGVRLHACVFVCPGVHLGAQSVVLATSMVTNNLPVNMICRGTPAIPGSLRWAK
jgi:putative colanic acid biosynthesis acetyltransferase WcaF